MIYLHVSTVVMYSGVSNFLIFIIGKLRRTKKMGKERFMIFIILGLLLINENWSCMRRITVSIEYIFNFLLEYSKNNETMLVLNPT